MAAETCSTLSAPPRNTLRHDLVELHAAQDALSDAYLRARLTGYRPGSPEMVALLRAEARYQLAKRR